MREFVTEAMKYLVDVIGAWGYPGVFILMALESSVFPVPSEAVMPPAGYHIALGKWTWMPVILAGTFGSLLGAYANYFASRWLGRPFLYKYGKYVLISPAKLEKCERFFTEHGEVATFIGRLLPVVRHLISIPAGLSRMNLLRFTLYTVTGAAIWVAVLTYIGFLVGENEELIKRHIGTATIGVVIATVVIIAIYVKARKMRAAKRGINAA